MAEWFKAAVLKTASPKGDVGSNPTPSAIHHAGCVAALNPTWFRTPANAPRKNAKRYAHSVKSRRDAREAEGARLLSEYPP